MSDLATQRIVIDAVIDTGYNGFLTLPSSTIEALGLRWRGSEDVNSLLGVGMLYGYELCIETIDGGTVKIKALEDRNV